MKWTDFGLREEILMGITYKNFFSPSPIQEEVLPLILSGKSVIARAKNGTGKTAAFLIPVLNMIDSSLSNVQAIILVPTRELALQTAAVLKELAKYTEIECMVSTGGTFIKEDVLRLKQPVHIIIGTPGRILDLSNKNLFKLNFCTTLVFDEADKLMGHDFKSIINQIFNKFSSNLQILLFSATFPAQVSHFLRKIPNIVKVNLMTDLTLKGLTNYYAYLDEREKVACLKVLFSKLKINQAIIFCNSPLRVELLTKKIIDFGFSCFFIHSKLDQKDRNKVFQNFRHGNSRCLVSTDLFTRGIDVPSINVVINFDFPSTAETYLHRTGRSGRFGHLGLAINFITDQDKKNLIRVERELNSEITPIPEDIDPSIY